MRSLFTKQKISWGLYDLANTIFSMNVISLYLPLWVASSFPRGEVWFAAAYSISMAATGILSPVSGALGGRIGHKRVLAVTTIMAVGITATLGFNSSLLPLLILFAIANFGYQLSIVAYNSLLPSVADPEDRGRVSGLGVALGYFGSFVGMLSVLPLIEPERFRRLSAPLRELISPILVREVATGTAAVRENAFLPTALLFGIFALPLFFFVREKKLATIHKGSFAEAWQTAREIGADRNLLLFFVATFLYMDAVHTTYIVMGTYGKLAIGLSDGDIVKIMSTAILTAIAGSFVYGQITDRTSKKTAVLIVILNWIVALTLAVFAQSFASFLVVAMVAGIGLGGVEVVGRVALLSLIPENESGRYFGFFGFIGKASSIVGPQVWAVTLLLFEHLGTVRYRIAVGLLGVMALVAAVTMARVRFGNGSDRVTLAAD
jgi:UMF1 family MFS transporter